jgi:hypothetical protein
LFASRDLEDAFPDHQVVQPELGSGGYKLAYLARRDGMEVVLKVTRHPLPGAADPRER